MVKRLPEIWTTWGRSLCIQQHILGLLLEMLKYRQGLRGCYDLPTLETNPAALLWIWHWSEKSLIASSLSRTGLHLSALLMYVSLVLAGVGAGEEAIGCLPSVLWETVRFHLGWPLALFSSSSTAEIYSPHQICDAFMASSRLPETKVLVLQCRSEKSSSLERRPSREGDNLCPTPASSWRAGSS